jgi:hypothetical protein
MKTKLLKNKVKTIRFTKNELKKEILEAIDCAYDCRLFPNERVRYVTNFVNEIFNTKGQNK